MTEFRPRLLLFSCVALLIALVGCSEPVEPRADAPEPENALFSQGNGSNLEVLATFNGPRNITIAWARRWIGPEGGRLDFQGFAIEVPAGAVEKVTQFSIHLPVDPKAADRVLARFGPHGATFKVPVTIEFPHSGTSIFGASDPIVVWWNPDTSSWEDFGGSTTPDGRLRTTTPHFSEFGTTTESGRTGVVIASGG